MIDRAQARAAFLRDRGWGAAGIAPLPGDASARRYFRLTLDQRRVLLMDAPPPGEQPKEFVEIAHLLRAMGYSAPEIIAADLDAGLVLVEDLGEATYTSLLAAGADETALYALAIDLLADLHARFDVTSPHGVPAYSTEFMLAEAALFIDWALPEFIGRPIDPAIRADYLARWRAALPAAGAVPSSLTLRDFHVDNLLLLADRPGLEACGLIDFQGALIGPMSYDLVSLLEDARRDVSASLASTMRRRYLAQRPELDACALDASMAVLGAQRHAKVIGIFCRLARRDGKPGYLRHLPRLWRLLDRALTHPALREVSAWMDEIIPPDPRRVPGALLTLAGQKPA